MVDFGKISLKSINKIQHDTGKSFTPDFNAFGIQRRKSIVVSSSSHHKVGVLKWQSSDLHVNRALLTPTPSLLCSRIMWTRTLGGGGRCCFVSSESSWGTKMAPSLHWREQSERRLVLCLLLWSLPPPAFHCILTCEWACAVFRRLTFFSSENQNLLFLFKVIAIYLSHLHFKNFK